MKACENCNLDHDGKFGQGRFCNVSCARSFSAKKISLEKRVARNAKLQGSKYPAVSYVRVCLSCVEEFAPPGKRPNQKYCSRLCARKANHRVMSRAAGLASVRSQLRRSKNEILFADLCAKQFVNVKTNVPIFNGWDADIVIEDLKIAVLWNGVWHYKKITQKHSIDQVETRDKIKLKEIAACGYEAYIVKDLGSYDPEFVKEEFRKFIARWSSGSSVVS